MSVLEKGFEVLEKINSLGYEAYIVGGAVRDYLLGIEIHDVDMTTNMPLKEISSFFDCYNNGLEYQSVTIKYKEESFEITHFRKDIQYKDHRHPMVELTDSFLEDSRRRDFTINAMAMDKEGNILDYHEGKKDLEKRELRIIGNPFERFYEDALRILRGIYFSSNLGFSIEKNTLEAMIEKKSLLSHLSKERIYQYFVKILYAKTNLGKEYIQKYKLFSDIPEFEKWLELVDSQLHEEDLIYPYYLKYSSYPMPVSSKVERNCKGLVELLQFHDAYTLYKNKEIYLSLKCVLSWLDYDIMGADKTIASFVIEKDSDLAMSKEEIASFFQGKEKKNAIEAIMRAVLNGEIHNTREEIMLKLGGILHV